jgi:hypothetical protein
MNLGLRDGQTTEAQSRGSELNEWQQYEKSYSSWDDKVPLIRSENDCK